MDVFCHTQAQPLLIRNARTIRKIFSMLVHLEHPSACSCARMRACVLCTYILISPGRHTRAGFACAKFRDASIEEIYLIEEIHLNATTLTHTTHTNTTHTHTHTNTTLKSHFEISYIINIHTQRHTVLTASHSFLSSPSGSSTASCKLPAPNVALTVACKCLVLSDRCDLRCPWKGMECWYNLTRTFAYL